MKLATDIGGTFTDLVFIDEKTGHIQTHKSATTPKDYEQGVLNVIEEAGLSGAEVDLFIHGTTVIINTLTERKGVKTGLITTKGFRDVLEIARGNRPDLFNVQYQKPKPVIPRALRLEVAERLNGKGEVLTPLNEQDIDEAIAFFKKEGVEAVAIAYLHAYVNPVHEQQTAAWIKEKWPEVSVSASYEISQEWREYERTNTTALNAYVKPIANTYLNQLDQHLNKHIQVEQEFVMQSNGGTTTFADAKETPITLVESGPAAGIYGTAALGKVIGEENLIAFDIGGTTAKTSLIENGTVKISTDYAIEKDDRHAGYPIKAPVVDIVEIGNGGGSIAWLDAANSLNVGPQSAGAYPGPIAYNLGGTQPTTTDANLYTGRLSAKNFDYEVDMEAVKAGIEQTVAQPLGLSAEEGALGIIRMANSNMLNAIKLVSIRKGHDPKDFTLVAFGGGGSMHAPALALELGIDKVVVPIASSVFAAWGMLLTDLRQDYIQTTIKTFNTVTESVYTEKWQQMLAKAEANFTKQGVEKEKLSYEYFLDMRYAGQEHTVKVPVTGFVLDEAQRDKIIADFGALHEKTYTFKLEDHNCEIVNYHLTVLAETEKLEIREVVVDTTLEEAFIEARPVYFEEKGWVETAIYDRNSLPVGESLAGPVIIEEATSATVVYPGQHVAKDTFGNLIIERDGSHE